MEVRIIEEKLKNGEIKTPCYIGDTQLLWKHIDNMLEIAHGCVDYCYAIKANPFWTKQINDIIHKVEVCSSGELEICKRLAIPGTDIIFSGVNKTEEDIKNAMEYGVSVVTLESLKHFERLKSYCVDKNLKVNVLIRLSSGAQFGMSEEELTEIVAHREECPNINILGIHYFTGTQKKQFEKIENEIILVDALIKKLKKEYGYKCKVFEYGAGLCVPYFEGDDFESRYSLLKQLIEYIGKQNFDYKVTLELGRFFVSESMKYVTRVDDIKQVEGCNLCLVDGGIHHLNYYGQNMAMRVPRIEVISMAKENAEFTSGEEWKVCGSLCTFADVLVRKASIGHVDIGDVLAFSDAGAYSITEAPALFLSRKMPNIYIFDAGGDIISVRNDKESFEINL